MSSNRSRRIALTLGAATGGLLAAALLPMAVATADTLIYEPDPSTMDATSITGDPPYTPLVVMGTESWSLLDLTDNQIFGPDLFTGASTNVIDGYGQTGYDTLAFTTPSDAGVSSTWVDYANLGGGWVNEWIAETSPLGLPAISDILITPMGDIPLFGTAFG